VKALLPLLLACAGCATWVRDQTLAEADRAALAAEPVIRVALVRPVELDDEGLQATSWQAGPLILMELPFVFWALLPEAFAWYWLCTIPQVAQSNPTSDAIELVQAADPALVAAESLLRTWNEAGLKPRLEPAEAPVEFSRSSPMLPHDGGSGPLLVLRTHHLQLTRRTGSSIVSEDFEAIPDAPPEFQLLVVIGAALVGADHRVLWATDGRDHRVDGERTDETVSRATLGRWTSGGGALLAEKLAEMGALRGQRLATELAVAFAPPATPGDPAPSPQFHQPSR